jgi:sulfite exporter TauE/SafE/copper chaperone CopZ
MQKCQIDIKGMHCRSCEILIEDELKRIPGVVYANVSHQNGTAVIAFKKHLDSVAVEKAVTNAGYSLGHDDKMGFFSRNRRDYVDLGIAFFLVSLLFLLAKTLGIFNLGSSISGNYSSLPIVFVIGLTAGVSTCMALVGGLVLGSAARFSKENPNASSLEKFKPHLLFNLGRIVSYFVFGGIIGWVGSFLQLSTSVLGILTVAVGMVMLVLGGQLIDIFPILKRVSFTLPKGISRSLGIQERAHPSILGASTFFLPCGFTQAMQLYAMSTGNPLQGALTMGVFALGTAPGLLGVGGLSSIVKGNSSKLFFKTAGVVVILLAFFNVSNGLNLLGVSTAGAFGQKAQIIDPNVTIKNGVQEVRMTQGGSGYSPNKFTIQKGIPVRWIINSESVYTCAASIVAPSLGIRQGLKLGENVFEFTPSEAGTIRFSCSMGMYTGAFTVVDGSTTNVTSPQAQVAAANTISAPAGNGGSCGGSSGGCGCGGGARKAVTTTSGTVETQGSVQLIKAVYTQNKDIVPNQFTVKAGQPVKFEIYAQDDGVGCMGSVTLPGLVNKVEVFSKGQTTTFEFAPTKAGTFGITCAMGIPRGQILVN